LKIEEEIKTLHDKPKLKEYMESQNYSTHENENKHSHERMEIIKPQEKSRQFVQVVYD
jgi:hypothetical protein